MSDGMLPQGDCSTRPALHLVQGVYEKASGRRRVLYPLYLS